MAGYDAIELTAAAAWGSAEILGAGEFPWVLAITAPISEPDQSEVIVDAPAADWIRTVCRAERWLELRYVRGIGRDLLRGFIARRGDVTVVALRNGDLVTFTAVDIVDPDQLATLVTVGLGDRRAASFAEFVLPTRVGARADERLRSGADLDGVLGNLGIPTSAIPVVRSAFVDPHIYVEIRAGGNRHGQHALSEVGIGIVDTAMGRVLVSPHRTDDAEWLSRFTPGTQFAIAVALERLTDTLPDGRWFPDAVLERNFNENKSQSIEYT